nr:hypothetical protein [Eubacterium sp.]
MDRKVFDQAIEKIVYQERERYGIGTLSEKTLHAVVKNYLEPNEDYHEVPLEGYVADIFRDGAVVEIQTANFNVLRRKLDKFLPLYPVTIVYPIPATKWVIWVDPETGEEVSRRKSPKKGSPYQAFKELYKIKQYLSHPNLRIRFLFIDLEETKILDGWSYDKKRGATKYDRVPKALVDEMYFERVEDYRMMIPAELSEFTTKDYAKSAKIPLPHAQTAMNIFHYLKLVERIGKKGNSYVYEVCE